MDFCGFWNKQRKNEMKKARSENWCVAKGERLRFFTAIPSTDTGLSLECREKKSLHHVVMVVKFLNDNKPKTSLKK